MNYYCYIAGMPDLQIDNPKSVPTLQNIIDDVTPLLSYWDLRAFTLLRNRYDNDNLLLFLKDKDADLNPLGTLSSKDWQEIIAIIDESNELNPAKDKRILPYVLEFYTHYKKEESTIVFPQEYLSSLYYEYGIKCNNSFISNWFTFNLNVNNILTALTCKKYNWEIKSALVGNNNVVDTIKTNQNAKDFNLKTEVDYIDKIINISDTTNLLDKERKIDLLKWEWLENNSFYKDFSVEKIFAFWLKAELMHRWDNLSQEHGSEIFRSMINDLKKDVKFK